MCALVTEDPVRPRRQAVEQPLGTEEVDVGKGSEEKQALDAGGEAHQVEHEGPAVVGGLQSVARPASESIQRKQNWALARMLGMFSTATNASARSASSAR